MPLVLPEVRPCSRRGSSAWLTDGGHLGLGPVEGNAVGGAGPWGVWGAAGLGTHGRPA